MGVLTNDILGTFFDAEGGVVRQCIATTTTMNDNANETTHSQAMLSTSVKAKRFANKSPKMCVFHRVVEPRASPVQSMFTWWSPHGGSTMPDACGGDGFSVIQVIRVS